MPNYIGFCEICHDYCPVVPIRDQSQIPINQSPYSFLEDGVIDPFAMLCEFHVRENHELDAASARKK